MSPEQARGHPIDKRTDIWAFGCVLYEMLTGRVAFDRDTVSDTIAAIIEREPDWSRLPADAPKPIVTLLRASLEKERRSRVADIGAASFVLDHAAQLAEPVEAQVAALQQAPMPPLPLWRRATPIAVALGIGALIASAIIWLLYHPVPASVVRTTVTTSGSTALALHGVDRDIAITPDGSRVVYRGNNQLLVRALNRLEPTVLSGLGAPRGVFVSPDGQWVGFFDTVTMKKVAITGGPPVTVCTIEGVPRGATWSEDGTIIFATSSPATGLQRVSAARGEPIVLTKPDRERGEADHMWPEMLPGSGAVLFTITPAGGSIVNSKVAVLDLQTGTSKVLIHGGSHAHYLTTGHLVYGVEGTLRAVAFDLGDLEVVGTPVPVLEGVVTTAQGAADVGVSSNGSLIYVPRVSGMQTVVSVDREGRASPLPGLSPEAYRDVRVSPDGSRLALATQTDVWTYDFVRATLSRLTTHPAPDTRPLWTPDGQRIVFTSTRAGYFEMFWRRADGTGSDERLLTRAKDLADLRGSGWSADGKQLVFTEMPPNVQCAIGQMAIEQPSYVRVLVKGDFCSDWATVSPNGHWMAYESNVSGRQEIYVERYPDLGDRQQISTGGGTRPLWSRNGRELFFASVDGRRMFALEVEPGTTTLGAGRLQMLFEFAMLVPTGGTQPYDTAPDGRFLIIRGGQSDAGGDTASNLIVVLNWSEELKRLAPPK